MFQLKLALLATGCLLFCLPVSAQTNSVSTINNMLPILQQQQTAEQQAEQAAQIQRQNADRAASQAAIASKKADDAVRSNTANPFGTVSAPASNINNPFATASSVGITSPGGTTTTSAAGESGSGSELVTSHHSSAANSRGPISGPRLVIASDIACSVKVDDGQTVDVFPDAPVVLKAALGDHIVTAITRDGKSAWHSTVTLDKPTSKAILISLGPAQRAPGQGSQSVAQLAAAAQLKMRETAARGQQQSQLVADRAQAVTAEREAKRKQLADIQSQINDLREEQEADQEAAQNFDAEAQLSQQQCTNLPAGARCYGAGVGGATQILAMQKRQEAQRLQLQINDLQSQMQLLTTQ